MAIAIQTARLILRDWRPEDLEPFALLNADPRVMEFFPKLLTREESDQITVRIQDAISKRGFSFWAAEVPGVAPFVGFIGLHVPAIQTAFTPCVEIGWRLAYEHWGKGYATEGALACLKYGWEKLKLTEIISMTTVKNVRSRHVMEKIGMRYTPADDFDHPSVPRDSPLLRHVLYRMSAPGCGI